MKGNMEDQRRQREGQFLKRDYRVSEKLEKNGKYVEEEYKRRSLTLPALFRTPAPQTTVCFLPHSVKLQL